VSKLAREGVSALGGVGARPFVSLITVDEAVASMEGMRVRTETHDAECPEDEGGGRCPWGCGVNVDLSDSSPVRTRRKTWYPVEEMIYLTQPYCTAYGTVGT
jgi:hypothetical protein